MSEDTAVVVTGVGLTIAPGLSAEHAWIRSCRGDSAIGHTRRFDPSAHRSFPGAEVPPFEIDRYLRIPKNEKFMADSVRYAMRSAKEAVISAQLDLATIDPYRIAVYTGSGQTGLESGEFFPALDIASSGDEATDFANLGGRAARALDHYFSLRTLSNAGIGLLSIELNAKGPSNNFVQDDTSAAMAIAAGIQDLQEGRCDVAIAGGYDSLLTSSTYLAYENAGLLSNEDPACAYRPFDRRRDGLVLGEGAGFVVLERARDAYRRRAPIAGELFGVGCGTEIDDVLQSKSSGAAITAAVEHATGGRPLDMVIAHGIGTREGDRQEAELLAAVVGCDVPVTAFKSMTGYVGAATAVVELILGLLASRERLVPPIARHEVADKDCRLSLVSERPRRLSADRPTVLSLSWSWFGRCAAIAARAPAVGLA